MTSSARLESMRPMSLHATGLNIAEVTNLTHTQVAPDRSVYSKIRQCYMRIRVFQHLKLDLSFIHAVNLSNATQ